MDRQSCVLKFSDLFKLPSLVHLVVMGRPSVLARLSSLALRAAATQVSLAFNSTRGGVAWLEIVNCWNWMYTTRIAVGNPPTSLFMAVIETAPSDLLFATFKCKPLYCGQHPFYSSSVSSTYVPDDRPSSLSNGLYYSDDNASINSYHVGPNVGRKHVFQAD